MGKGSPVEKPMLSSSVYAPMLGKNSTTDSPMLGKNSSDLGEPMLSSANSKLSRKNAHDSANSNLSRKLNSANSKDHRS